MAWSTASFAAEAPPIGGDQPAQPLSCKAAQEARERFLDPSPKGEKSPARMEALARLCIGELVSLGSMNEAISMSVKFGMFDSAQALSDALTARSRAVDPDMDP